MVRVTSPTFVGRAAELEALDRALDAAELGQPTTILISGDPGVGKTRLLQAWNERAVRDRGARIAVGSCLDLGETGPAYTALVEALRDLLDGLDATEIENLVGPARTVPSPHRTRAWRVTGPRRRSKGQFQPRPDAAIRSTG